jgi:hypothetical protein
MADKKYVRNRDKKSQFHFIYNTQMDMYKFMEMTEREQRALIQGLLNSVAEFKKNFKDYVNSDTPKDKNKLKIEKYTAGLEFGSKNPKEKRARHLLHVDAYVGFNGYCMLRYDKITQMFNTNLAPFGIHGFFRNAFVKDGATDAFNYTKKEGMSLTDS